MKTKLILNMMNVLAWIIFIGLCISAGTLLYSFLLSIFSSEGIIDPLNGVDLFALKNFGTGHFLTMGVFLIMIPVLKALMFYLIIKIFMKLNLVEPFSLTISKLLSSISYVAIAIGLLSFVIIGYGEWLTQKGVFLTTLHEFSNAPGEFIFFAGILFIVSLIFKRGIEIQSEQELTV